MNIQELYEVLREIPDATDNSPELFGIFSPGGGEEYTQIGGPQALDLPGLRRQTVSINEAFPRADGGDGPLEGLIPAAEELDEVMSQEIDARAAEWLEALAWYRSFRFGTWAWGIFISEAAIARVTDLLADGDPTLRMRAVDAAVRMFFRHEAFHFIVDIAAASMEIAERTGKYLPWRGSLFESPPGYSELEEALANANAAGRYPAPFGPRVKKFLARGPVGYRGFGTYRRPEARAEGLRCLATEIRSDCSAFGPEILGDLLFDLTERTVQLDVVPVFIVHDLPAGPWAVRYVDRIVDIEETQKFKKALAKLDRGSRAVSKLWEKALGWMAAGEMRNGRNFEKLTSGYFSVRLDNDIRAILDFDGGWKALDVGHHDIYRKY